MAGILEIAVIGGLKLSPISSTSTNPWSSFSGINNTNNDNDNTWLTSSASGLAVASSSLTPGLLPPEPDCLSDPFDLGWVDRATASVVSVSSNTSSTDKTLSNPFVITNRNALLNQDTFVHNQTT
ncbi:unnamed protein product [Trichobilharzia regenti]|nr:unnamed protein product [Trichobilharzia regenti]